MTLPVFYSFRRCPYAIRARMAIAYSETKVELREILLKEKPLTMLQASAKATVPVLVLENNHVIDESRDVMMWALSQKDQQSWFFGQEANRQNIINTLIDENDNEFKPILDRYKYAVRFPEQPEETYRDQAIPFLTKLNSFLETTDYLLGEKTTLADIALFPFIRQFAFVNKAWFDQCEFSFLKLWLDRWLNSHLFKSIMTKYKPWQPEDHVLVFPEHLNKKS